MTYKPPFTVSAKAVSNIAEISALVERYAIRLEQKDALKLRKANKIKTIHSSLAIEGNSLSVEQVSDILEGKKSLLLCARFKKSKTRWRLMICLTNWIPFPLTIC